MGQDFSKNHEGSRIPPWAIHIAPPQPRTQPARQSAEPAKALTPMAGEAQDLASLMKQLQSIRQACDQIQQIPRTRQAALSDRRLREVENKLRHLLDHPPAKSEDTHDQQSDHPSDNPNSPFRKLFDNVDTDGNKMLSHDEVETALKTVPQLVLSESLKLREFRDKLEQAECDYETFHEAIDDLYFRRYHGFCTSAGEAFGKALEELMLDAMRKGELHGEGEDFHALKALSNYGDKSRRADVMLDFSIGCLPQVVAAMVQMLQAEQEYREEEAKHQPARDRFSDRMVLCDDWIFSQGLEQLVGFPEFKDDRSILKKIEQEHTEGKNSEEQFESYNDSEKRQTTAKEEWQKIMPGGWEGSVYSKTYAGDAMPNWEDGDIIDIMEHPKVKDAGLKKYEVVAVRLYTGPMYFQYNSILRRIGSLFEEILDQKRRKQGTANVNNIRMIAHLTGVANWADEEAKAFKTVINNHTTRHIPNLEVEVEETNDVIARRLRLTATLDIHVRVSGFQSQEDALEALQQVMLDKVAQECCAELQKEEGAKGFAALKTARFSLQVDEDSEQMGKVREEALREAREQAGPFPYATTVHAITSGLIKVSRITRIPAKGKVYRGMAGRNLSARFLNATKYGSRVGNELGFMSTTPLKDTAIDYIQDDQQQKQLFEIQIGQVDRGADIAFLSLFPNEQEILFPPNSCIEVVGSARYEYTNKGVVMVWPLRVNINLKARTIEDFQAMRKKLLLEAASNTLHLVDVYLEAPESPGAEHKVAEELKKTIQRACQAEVESLQEPGQEEYNDDTTYCIAYEWLTDIKPLAEDMLELAKTGQMSELDMQNPRQEVALRTQKLLQGTQNLQPNERARHAEKLCRMKKLYKRHKEEPDSYGETPLLHWAREGYFFAVGLLLDADANANAVTKEKDSTLHLAAKLNHQHVVNEWTKRGLTTEKLNEEGNTPLLEAAAENSVAAVEVLLAANADVNFTRKKDGKTALFLAAEKGKAGALEVLINGRATVDVKDLSGRSALLAAAEALPQSEAAFDTLMTQGNANIGFDDKIPSRVLERLDIFVVLCKAEYYSKLLEFADKPEFKKRLLHDSGHSAYLEQLEKAHNAATSFRTVKQSLDSYVKVARYLIDVGGEAHLAAAFGVIQAGIGKANGTVSLESPVREDASDRIYEHAVKIANVKLLGLLVELYGRKRYKPPREGFDAVLEMITVLRDARKLLERANGLKDHDEFGEEYALEEATVFEGTGYLYLFNKKKVLAAEEVSEEDSKKEGHTAEHWFRREMDALCNFDWTTCLEGRSNPSSARSSPTPDAEPGYAHSLFEDLPLARIRKVTDALNALGTAYQKKLEHDKPENVQEHMAYKQALQHYKLSVEVGKDFGANQEDIARSLMSRGNFMAYAGEKYKAKSDLGESVQLFEVALGKKHPRTIGARKAYAQFLSSFDVFAWLCNNGSHSEVLDLAKTIPEFREALVQGQTCVYLKDLGQLHQRATTALERKGVLDSFVKVAQFLTDCPGPQFLAAAHNMLITGKNLAQASIDNTKKQEDKQEQTDTSVLELAKARMLGVLNELYGRKRYKPPSDKAFDSVVEQKKVLEEARESLRVAKDLKKHDAFKADMVLEEAMVLEGLGYLYMYNEKAMSDDDRNRNKFGEYWFEREIAVLYPRDGADDDRDYLNFEHGGSTSRQSSGLGGDVAHDEEASATTSDVQTFDLDRLKDYPTARIRKLADALNALGTAFEQKLKNQASAEVAASDNYRSALAAYDSSVKVAGCSGNQADLARSHMSRGNLQKLANQKEAAVTDLEKSVKLFRDALGESHPRTKNALKCMANLLTELDVFLWLSPARVMELGKSNVEFFCRLVGIDPKKATDGYGPILKQLQTSHTERRASSFDELKDMRKEQQPCCYLDGLRTRYDSCESAPARMKALHDYVKVAQFLMEVGGDLYLRAAYNVLCEGQKLAAESIGENEIKFAQVRILVVQNELFGRKRFKPTKDFVSVSEQKKVLEDARELLQGAEALKCQPELIEDFIIDEASVMEGTGYLYLFNKDAVMSAADKRERKFGHYWFRKEIDVLHPREGTSVDSDAELTFSESVVKRYPTPRICKLADALNALGTAIQKDLENDKSQYTKVECGAYKSALEAYNWSVEVAGWSGQKPDLARSLMSRGNLQKLVDEEDQALKDLTRSLELFEAALGEFHPRTKGARKPLDELKQQIKRGAQSNTSRASSGSTPTGKGGGPKSVGLAGQQAIARAVRGMMDKAGSSGSLGKSGHAK